MQIVSHSKGTHTDSQSKKSKTPSPVITPQGAASVLIKTRVDGSKWFWLQGLVKNRQMDIGADPPLGSAFLTADEEEKD